MPCAQRVGSSVQSYRFDPRAIYFFLAFGVAASGSYSRARLVDGKCNSLDIIRYSEAPMVSASLYFLYISLKDSRLYEEQINERDLRAIIAGVERNITSTYQGVVKCKLIKGTVLSFFCQICITAFRYKERESILNLSFLAMILAQELVKFLMMYAIEYYKPGGPSLNDLSHCSSFSRNSVGGQAGGHDTLLDGVESDLRLQGESGSDTPLPSDGCVLS